VQTLLAIAAALVIGIMLAAQLGPAMLDPMFFIPFTCLAAFFAGQSHTELLWRSVLRSLGLMAGILTVALTLINLDPPHNLLPDAQTWIGAIALSLSSTFLAASAYRWVAGRFRVSTAKWSLRAAMLALYCVYRWMPGEWLVWINEQTGTHGVAMPCLAIAAVLAAIAWAIQRRATV